MTGSSVTNRGMRRTILRQAKRAKVGHIGSALSALDLVAAIYAEMRDETGPDRDRFILSNGHAALALYAVLHAIGRITDADLDTFACDESFLGVHPQHSLDAVDFTTGSLGHGLSIGAGAALGARLSGSARRVFAVLSDAECNEGSVWEAAMFAAQRGLSNLVVVIDLNGQQALGYTRDVLNVPSMAERWRAFGWEAHDVDGHDGQAMREAIVRLDMSSEHPPHVLVAHTTFGCGVSFMENQIPWHYLSMSDDHFAAAMAELAEPA